MEGKLGDDRQTDGCCSERACKPQDAFAQEGARAETPKASRLFRSRIRAVPWTFGDVLFAIVLFVPAGALGSLGLAFALIQLAGVDDRTLAAILGSVLLPVALLAGAWLFGLRRRNGSLAQLGFRGASFGSLTLLPMAALAIGLSIIGAYALLMNALGFDMLVPEQNLDEIAALEGTAWLAAFAIVGALAPLGEEVFFRGFLLAALLPALGGFRGALVSSAVFSVAHLNVSTLLPIFVLGMLLAWLYLRTGSILPPLVAHAAQNMLALTLLDTLQ